MKIVTNIKDEIEEILEHMREGNPIILPTDTNYNLACFPKSKKQLTRYLNINNVQNISLFLYFFLSLMIGKNMV